MLQVSGFGTLHVGRRSETKHTKLSDYMWLICLEHSWLGGERSSARVASTAPPQVALPFPLLHNAV